MFTGSEKLGYRHLWGAIILSRTDRFVNKGFIPETINPKSTEDRQIANERKRDQRMVKGEVS